MNAAITGIVLAGGLSSRMGQHKAAIKLFGCDGPDLLEHTADLLARHCSDVQIACRQGQRYSGYACIHDTSAGAGPIAGIHAALMAVSGPILVLSCDLPFMDDTTVAHLIAARNERPHNAVMTTYCQEETGFIEALVSIYEPACLPLFTNAIAKGVRKVDRVVPLDDRCDVIYAQAESFPFFNINYPSDLELARRVVTHMVVA